MNDEIMPADEVDRWPRTNAELDRRRGLLRGQLEAITPAARSIFVVCPCGKAIALHAAYKCFECGVWLCENCARRHFRSPRKPVFCVPSSAGQAATPAGPPVGKTAPAWSMRPRHQSGQRKTAAGYEIAWTFSRETDGTIELVAIKWRRVFRWYDPRSWPRRWHVCERSEADRASDRIFEHVKHGKTTFVDLAEGYPFGDQRPRV